MDVLQGRAAQEKGVRAALRAVLDNVARVIVGKDRVVEFLLASLVAGGHVLIEDVPGVGKTSLVRAIAGSLGLTFKRIQFTPDLMPADVTGVSIYDQRLSCFRFQQGPVFTQVLLADEINRTSPKTQSSLLEAMEEHQVSVDGVSHRLPEPFFVLATENPVEYEGTFPLPEAQLDRFMLKVSIGYPSVREEIGILWRHGAASGPILVEAVATSEQVQAAQTLAAQVRCSDAILDYIVRVVQATRHHADIYLGASPRGSLSLLRASRALAYIRGRDFVLPDDVKQLVIPALGHRVLLKPEARLAGITTHSIFEEMLSSVAVPASD